MIIYLSNYIVANPFQRQARLDRATAMPAVCVSSLNKYSDNLMRHLFNYSTELCESPIYRGLNQISP